MSRSKVKVTMDQNGGKRSGALQSNGTLYGDLCKNGLTDRHAVLGEDLGRPKKPSIRWSADHPSRRGSFGGFPPH